MKASEVPRAVAAGMSTASALGLRADDAVVIHDSNRIAVRLQPCDVLARVAYVAHQAGAKFEVEVARRLAQTDSPVAELEPRVEPRVYVRGSFAVTLWKYYEPVLHCLSRIFLCPSPLLFFPWLPIPLLQGCKCTDALWRDSLSHGILQTQGRG